MSIADKLATIAENEQRVYDAGYMRGSNDGYVQGEQNGYDRGFNEGKKSEYDAFWDVFQDYGNKRNYRYAFANCSWGEKTFKPKYKIILGDNSHEGIGMFHWFGDGAKDPPFDFRTVKDMVDTSQTQDAQDMFNSANMNYIDVDLSNCRRMFNCFGGGWQKRKLTHITLKVSEKCTNYEYAFASCTDLTDLTFKDGSVIAASIDLSDCPLSRESIESVINALSSSASGKTATFNKSAKEAAFADDEWSALVATKPDWAFAFV